MRDDKKRQGSISFLAFWPDRGRGPNGRVQCRYCGGEVGVGNGPWCSERCRKEALHRFSLANDPAYQRRAVWARDQGVCAACGRDTLKLRHRLQAARTSERARLAGQLLHEGYDRHRLERLVLWEMDHVRPVAEGGGGTGLDNLQTLCVPCHKQKTSAEGRRRRAKQQGLRDLFGE